MSTFNGELFIEEQLDSIFNQSYKVDEVIIIDDCSSDDTVKIIKKYIDIHNLENCWKLIQNEFNKGWKANYMEGVEHTTGDILFFCDQDDKWFSNKVEIESEILLKNSDIQVVASHEILWYGDESENIQIVSDEYSRLSFDEKGRHYFIECSGCTMAVKRAYLDSILKYYSHNWAHDDFLWKYAILDKQFVLLKESTILHRIHDNNESRKKRNLKDSIVCAKTDIKAAQNLMLYLETKYSSKNNFEIDQNYISKMEIMLSHKIEMISRRLNFLQKCSIYDFIIIGLRGLDIYRRKRQWIGDFILAYGIKK